MLDKSVQSTEIWVENVLSLPESGTDQSYNPRRVTRIKSNSLSIDIPKKGQITPRKQYSSEDYNSPLNISSLPHTFTPGWKFLRNDSKSSENAVSVYQNSDTKSFATLLNQQMCCQRMALACWYGPYYFLMYLILGIMLLVLIISDLCANDFTVADRLWFRTVHLVVVVMLSLDLLIRMNAIRLGRIECLMDLLVIVLALFTLSFYWTAPHTYIVGDVDSPKEIFLVARYIINILCMGYLFTKQLQRNYYNRVFMLGSYQDDCRRRELEEVRLRRPQAVSYNTFTSTGIRSDDTRDEEKLCCQQTKDANSKQKHVHWGRLENETVQNYRTLKKSIHRGRVP